MIGALAQLTSLLDDENLDKIRRIRHPKAHEFLIDAIKLCEPDSVFIVTDDPDEIEQVRQRAIETGEEIPLKLEGHTVHFDGYYDQARDVEHTRYLVPRGESLDRNLRQVNREKGISEIRDILKGSMHGKEMIVRFFSLGPTQSPFSILTMQITDSYYVAHSLDLLYRSAFEQFVEQDIDDCFLILHSAGRTENMIPVDIDKRRIYIDYTQNTVYSVNTTYAGNTVGLKKLAFRLAIRKADREGWLAEHMFIMAVHGPDNRKTYLAGAFPSGCGKTSTAMVTGETIVGDDLAYLKRFGDEVRTANVESGIFGIIRGVNEKDDPVIFKCLTTPGEVIFSNVLVSYGIPYWLGDEREHPHHGINHAGEWYKGMIGPDGKEVPESHRNARYTLRLSSLNNLDTAADDPSGVPLGGIIYGGRDPDTSVPVWESFNWDHGVATIGASLESETTAATLGQEGVLKFQAFSNLDFISIPLGKYIQNHFNFVKGLSNPPKIFGVNYFLRGADGEYLNSKQAKRVWLKWIAQRINGDVEALRTPLGLIPRYEDLKMLFREVLDCEYTWENYMEQFTIRIEKLIPKYERILKIYREEAEETPQHLLDILDDQLHYLKETRKRYGDRVTPDQFST
ncbi:MAG: phosphoenolpyruvate carboxykinase (GTP) [Candidatus Thorarchaeota archaeon]